MNQIQQKHSTAKAHTFANREFHNIPCYNRPVYNALDPRIHEVSHHNQTKRSAHPVPPSDTLQCEGWCWGVLFINIDIFNMHLREHMF